MRKPIVFVLLFVLALATGLTALAQDPAKETRAQEPAQPAKSAASDSFIIGPEDVLAINVWREPEISRTVPVRPDGKISLPLLGEMQASGKTAKQLQADITTGLQKFLDKPEVTVIVQEVHSLKFNIIGQVMRPGAYPLINPMTVLDGIATAGGFRDFAKTGSVYILRRTPNGQNIRLPFNYKDVVKGKNTEQNVALESSDTIVVP